MSAFKIQEGGSHYQSLAIQPVEYIHKNKLGFCEGCVVKYVTRWRDKGGIEDLKKAKHFIDLLMEMEGNGNTRPVEQGKVTDGETVREVGEWVKVSAPSQVPDDLKVGDEIERYDGKVFRVALLFNKATGNKMHIVAESEGSLITTYIPVYYDEISAYRRKA